MTRALLLTLTLHAHVAFPQTEWTADQREVVDAIEGYLKAWNDSDAEALASYCDVDCDRINARGTIWEGKDAILEHYTELFENAPDGVERSLSYEIFSVRLITSDVAVVDARYELRGAPTVPPRTIRGMNTVVLVKKDGRWLRAAHRQRIPFVLPANEGDGS